MLKKTIEWTIPLVLAGIMTGCATYRPPAQIQSAVATVNRHTPEYVTEANKALREAFMLTKFSAEVRAYAVAVIAQQLQVSLGKYRSMEAMSELTLSIAAEINSTRLTLT